MTVTIAMAQAATSFGPNAREENLASAYRYAERARAQGAVLVCFPESFPGPWRMPISWTPVDELCAIARELELFVIGGFADPIDDHGGRCTNNLVLVGPDGGEIGQYRRTTPAHAPWIYKGGEYWDFDWVPANELPVFETDLGTIGLLICSEVYAPELARILALKGAELVFLPAGLMGSTTSLTATWRTLIWARAIENLMCTAICSNVVAAGEQGLTMICTPEEIILESRVEGVHVASIDLDRVRWLREERDRLVDEPEPWRTKPGTLRDWRRQEVFDANPLLAYSGDGPRATGQPASAASPS